MPGDNLSFWGVKLYADFRLCRGVSTRNPPVAQGSRVLTLKGSLHQGQLPKNWNALTSVAVFIPVTQQKTPRFILGPAPLWSHGRVYPAGALVSLRTRHRHPHGAVKSPLGPGDSAREHTASRTWLGGIGHHGPWALAGPSQQWPHRHGGSPLSL